MQFVGMRSGKRRLCAKLTHPALLALVVRNAKMKDKNLSGRVRECRCWLYARKERGRPLPMGRPKPILL